MRVDDREWLSPPSSVLSPQLSFRMPTRCGVIAIAGRPNAGKSSLLNAILGTRLAMVSPKAQATRVPTVGVHTTEDTQFIFEDLPGLLDPAYALQRSMRQLALEGLGHADLILHLHPANEAPAPPLEDLIPDLVPIAARVTRPAPRLLVYPMADLVPEATRDALTATGAVVVSERDPRSIALLLDRMAPMLPTGSFRHDPEEIGTQPLRFFVGEYLREAAFTLLEDEVPYSVTAEVDEFREDREPVYIRATLYVERDSQKGIVIGKGGAVLKQIGSHARARLEALMGQPVYLETWVKVLPKWRRSRGALARFGFPLPEGEES
jgi:GTP-binding protein Era